MRRHRAEPARRAAAARSAARSAATGWVVALCLVAGALAAAPAGAWPWRAEDVAASERYREAERERALRYRAEVARRDPSPAAARSDDASHDAAARSAGSPAPPSAPPPGASAADEGLSWVTGLLARALAGLDLDGSALRSRIGELRAWLAWWRDEGIPRWQALVAWLDRLLPIEPAAPEPPSFTSRVAVPAPSNASATPDDPGRSWWAEERARLREAGLESLATRAP